MTSYFVIQRHYCYQVYISVLLHLCNSSRTNVFIYFNDKHNGKWAIQLFKFYANAPPFVLYNWSLLIEVVLLIRLLNFDHNAFFQILVNFHGFSWNPPKVIEFGLKTKKPTILAESLKAVFMFFCKDVVVLIKPGCNVEFSKNHKAFTIKSFSKYINILITARFR